MRKAIAILPVVSAIYPMITYQPWLDIIHDDTTSQPADKELMNRTRFQTGQSASYHKQRQNKEVETVDPASRYEHQGTDAEENQTCYHSPPVAPLPDNPSGRQRHQKVGTRDDTVVTLRIVLKAEYQSGEHLRIHLRQLHRPYLLKLRSPH